MDRALDALQAVDFDWTTHIDSIWRDSSYDVPELQDGLRRETMGKLEKLFTDSTSASPLGLVLIGPGGAGKTHMLSLLRSTALARGAYFVLVDMTDVRDFWETTLLGYIRSLGQKHSAQTTQQEHLLSKLVERSGAKLSVEQLTRGRPPGLINLCDSLIKGLRRSNPELQEHQDVLRALVLLGSSDFGIRDLGWKWLQAIGLEDNERVLHGFHRSHGTPREIVRGLSFLMSLTAPTLLALDQLDAIVAEQQLIAGETPDAEQSARSASALAIIQGIAKGLIALRDTTLRTQTVVSCLENSWDVLKTRGTMSDRFFPPLMLRMVLGAHQAQLLVERRLAPAYRDRQFAPPYPSYPFKPTFFGQMLQATPREVLKLCDEHRWNCLRQSLVTEIGVDERTSSVPKRGDSFASLRAQFKNLCDSAQVEDLLDQDDESGVDALLETACRALAIENRAPEDVDVLVDLDFAFAGSYVPLHARIRMIYRSKSERERHYAVRFLQKSHHLAFQARLKAAMTASGIDHSLGFRRLTLFRRGPLPHGAATTRLIEEFRERGGRIVEPSLGDLRALSALTQMLAKGTEAADVHDWLQAEPVVSRLSAFADATNYLFADMAKQSLVAPDGQASSSPEQKNEASLQSGVFVAESSPQGMFVGHKLMAGTKKDSLLIPTENLAKHTVILAGAGSGKTVLVRRIVEEAVLLGIPAIVLDGANDLSRLGDPWPQSPESFSEEDRKKAIRYGETAEVVIWTPGRESGNPLALDPMPDFADAAGDEDDFQAALDMARSGLEPFIGSSGKGADKKRGVLAGALRYFAKLGGGSMREFVGVLTDLPADANVGFEKGDKIARDIGESILAAIETNPLLRGSGAALDVGTLLTARTAGRTRVSVVNLSGLPDVSAQQQFANQLATSLFTWIKKHPPRDHAIRGLLVIDEARDFVPSGKAVPSKDNLIRLAAQARKYGLGIVFATQAPKSIDHNVIANCSTQFFGRANSPAAIQTVQEQLRERGGGGGDIAKLPKGTFYVFTEGLKAPVKIATQLCLSHHPSSPPEEAEIIRRAAESRKRCK